MTHSGYINYDANNARLDDLQRRSRGFRQGDGEPVSIRRAAADDGPVLERLAALDSAATPRGDVLIAEVAGEPLAAIEVAGGAAVADPFRRTARVVELLRARLQAA